MTNKISASRVFFTDLDGTLLDHKTYSYDPALEGLYILRKNNIPLIMVSSKTFSEMKELSVELSLDYPFIFENGGGIGRQENNDFLFNLLGLSSDELYAKKNLIEAFFNTKVKMFNDMQLNEIVELTGLSHEKALKASEREASQPFIFTDNYCPDFKQILHFNEIYLNENISLTKGGRFFHLISSNVSKGRAIKFLLDDYFIKSKIITAAAGDSENDLPMLAEVDFPYVVKNMGKKNVLNLENFPDLNVYYTHGAGPTGFTEAVKNFISQ